MSSVQGGSFTCCSFIETPTISLGIHLPSTTIVSGHLTLGSRARLLSSLYRWGTDELLLPALLSAVAAMSHHVAQLWPEDQQPLPSPQHH